jgi:hypothetical protein
MKPGGDGTVTHDYKRHGTTILFVTLDIATGNVIGHCMHRHWHQKFLRFLPTIARLNPSVCMPWWITTHRQASQGPDLAQDTTAIPFPAKRESIWSNASAA